MTSKKSNWIFAAHAIETAYSYWKASEQLWPQFPNVAVINAALSIEIALKSFNVEVSGNKGKIEESYSFKSNLKGPERHDLIKLYDILPDDLKCRLLDKSDLYYLDKHRDTFIVDRYIYEKDAQKGASNVIIGIAGDLVQNCVELYKEKGCKDPWILNHNWIPN